VCAGGHGGDGQFVVKMDVGDDGQGAFGADARKASMTAALGTAQRTMSQPSAAKRPIWARVASASPVGVLVMD